MDALDLPTTQPATIAVRMGCALAYEVAQAASILLLVKPYPCADRRIVDERSVLSTGTARDAQSALEALEDSHGNAVLRAVLSPGRNAFRYDAVVIVPNREDNHGLPADPAPIERMPLDVLRYCLPSRYCESDKLTAFARQKFGHLPRGGELAQAICDWVHANTEYRYGSGSQAISACDALERGYGVCRDFAHIMVALCRALDLPARYAAGHIPFRDAARAASHNAGDTDIGTDFHAYAEVYLGGCWHIYDARHNRPFIGRIKVAHGMDAADAAFATIYGEAVPVGFEVWAYQVDSSTAQAVQHMPQAAL